MRLLDCTESFIIFSNVAHTPLFLFSSYTKEEKHSKKDTLQSVFEIYQHCLKTDYQNILKFIHCDNSTLILHLTITASNMAQLALDPFLLDFSLKAFYLFLCKIQTGRHASNFHLNKTYNFLAFELATCL